jgi:hypothetical protein
LPSCRRRTGPGHTGAVPVTRSEIEGAIAAVEALNFNDDDNPSLESAIEISSKTSPTANDLREMVCHLRGAFESALMDFCDRKKIQIPYRSDFSKLNTKELWAAAKDALSSSGQPVALTFVSDVEANRKLYVDEPEYTYLAGTTLSELQSALVILRDSSVTVGAQRTKFEAIS